MGDSVLSDWRNLLGGVLQSWNQDGDSVVISADVDGLLSCAFVALRYPVKVIGIYTTTHLVLLDGATPLDAARALWLDHDVSELGVRCIGQHLVHRSSSDNLPLREPNSFNPNVWVRQSWENSFRGRGGKKRDKYPYGTCHFLANYFGVDTKQEVSTLSALMAHADGTWRTVVDYALNAKIWYDLMFDGDEFLEYVQTSWHSNERALAKHTDVVNDLHAAGVTNSPSRAKIARLLPRELGYLTGSQSIKYLPTNTQTYVERIRSVLAYCAAAVGTQPTMGVTPTQRLTGTVETPYPNRVENFDEFMLAERIFSHAFTDFRTLSYTKGITLTQPDECWPFRELEG